MFPSLTITGMSNDSIIRGAHKDVRPVLREISEMGGVISITGSCHIKVRLGGHMAFVSLSPKNPSPVVSDLRRLIRRYNGEESEVRPTSHPQHTAPANKTKKNKKRKQKR